MKQHPLFVKYTREWLHQATGYSKGYLSRVATGAMPLGRFFITRVCLSLNQPKAELFLPDGTQLAQGSRGCAASKIGQWVEEECKREHMSLRQVAAKTGLSHSTIADIIKGSRPLPETITKLAQGFGGDGKRGLALQDHLLVLAGYRTPRPGEEPNELLAQLMDKAKQLNELQIKMMMRFAESLLEMEEKEHAATP